ncbi:EAL domain-containing protein [Ruminobacter amylophilus]|uniref:EAL domain-containing protein n=1 Tax=Ruminobacter amylophilus TaxID=867 RepID=A0A662ZK71_9GAMM|nr:EAL domain-containing protein [Ruminobacter amylophilus]
MLMSKDSDSRKSFETLRGMGVKISMDDFGTGYSNLSYLSSFPLDKLKIDRRFVTNIDSSKGNQQIVNAIIMLAQAFNLSLIAEGVEGGKELKYLQSKGVDVIQGFYFSKPLPPEQVYDFVNDVKNGVWISKVHDSFEKLDDHYSDKIGKKESMSVTVNK